MTRNRLLPHQRNNKSSKETRLSLSRIVPAHRVTCLQEAITEIELCCSLGIPQAVPSLAVKDVIHYNGSIDD